MDDKFTILNLSRIDLSLHILSQNVKWQIRKLIYTRGTMWNYVFFFLHEPLHLGISTLIKFVKIG
jgi:hypothetical protein